MPVEYSVEVLTLGGTQIVQWGGVMKLSEPDVLRPLRGGMVFLSLEYRSAVATPGKRTQASRGSGL